jgi:hypothetical protein
VTASTASTDLVLQLLGPQGFTLPVRATLTFDRADPFAVVATFYVGHVSRVIPVCWTFARDLLDDGVREPAGEGDVTVRPDDSDGPAAVVLRLASPEGTAVLRADRDAVTDFLAATFALVPRGAETAHLDIDAAIAALLAA